jgi:hypothetical protein
MHTIKQSKQATNKSTSLHSDRQHQRCFTSFCSCVPTYTLGHNSTASTQAVPTISTTEDTRQILAVPTMNLLDASEPGPSRPQRTSSSHRREPSWEFGDFSAAPSPQPHTTLGEGDLLGSFENLSHAETAKPSAQPVSTSTTSTDLLDDEGWSEFFTHQQHTRPPEPIKPMVIDLPPRPSEISPDYVPPPAPPRRMSRKRLSFSGPSSPPLVSHIGGDFTYRPTPESQRNASSSTTNSTHQSETSPRHSSPPMRSPTQSKLMHTLATTTKMASKWKTVLDPSMFHPLPDEHSSPSYQVRTGFDHEPPARSTAEIIEVTHTTPFATREQVAGSYTAPVGAPAFNANEKRGQRHGEAVSEWPDTKLVGRRAGTSELLTPHVADSLRQALPPRQRLSNSWSLVCKSSSSSEAPYDAVTDSSVSLDQHGASLSTMYRLAEKYADSHRGAGNLMIVRDGGDRLFGVYLNESIQKKEGTYYGSGESYVSTADHGVDTTHPTGSCSSSLLTLLNRLSFAGLAVINTMPSAKQDSHLSVAGKSSFCSIMEPPTHISQGGELRAHTGLDLQPELILDEPGIQQRGLVC